jgi:hypothetical protein
VGAIEAVFSRCTSLADAIRAGLVLRPAWSVVEVVVQDEYNHDVIFAPDGAGPETVVLDCT